MKFQIIVAAAVALAAHVQCAQAVDPQKPPPSNGFCCPNTLPAGSTEPEKPLYGWLDFTSVRGSEKVNHLAECLYSNQRYTDVCEYYLEPYPGFKGGDLEAQITNPVRCPDTLRNATEDERKKGCSGRFLGARIYTLGAPHD